MLQLFSVEAYALLEPTTTLSFVISFVVMKLYVLPKTLMETFSVSTPVGDSLLAK